MKNGAALARFGRGIERRGDQPNKGETRQKRERGLDSLGRKRLSEHLAPTSEMVDVAALLRKSDAAYAA